MFTKITYLINSSENFRFIFLILLSTATDGFNTFISDTATLCWLQFDLDIHNGTSSADLDWQWWEEFVLVPVCSDRVLLTVLEAYEPRDRPGFVEVEFQTAGSTL